MKEPGRRALQNHLILASKVAISGGLIWLLADSLDLGAARARIMRSEPWMLAAAALVLVVQIGLGAARWHAVLDVLGASPGVARLVRLFYVGAFFNQVLPAPVSGDAVRMYICHRDGLDLGSAISGVVLERAAMVVALVLLVDVTQPWFVARIQGASAPWIVPGLAALTLATVSAVTIVAFLDRLPRRSRRWRLVRGLARFGRDTRRVFLRPSSAARVLLWSVLANLNMAFAGYLLAVSLTLEVSLFECIVLILPVFLAMNLPISIAGWGVRETAMVASFGLIGVPAEGSLVLAVLFGLMGLAVSLPGGLLWLATSGRADVVAGAGAIEGDRGRANGDR